MTSPRVVVVGSLHYDVMVEAPDRPRKGETMVGRRWWPKCGGKGGNQAVEAARAGAEVVMVGAVGPDNFGTALLENLARAKVDHRPVRVVAGAASGMSVAIIDDSGDYGAVIVSGSNLTLGPDTLPADAFTGAGILILQNEIPEPANLAAARLARAAGARVLLNAAPARPLATALLALVDILIVNAIEAEMLGAAPVVTLEDAARAAETLSRQAPTVIVTAGASGVAVHARTKVPGTAFTLPALPITPQSTHGAGDCFVGTLAAELAKGVAIKDAVSRANAAAANLVATPEDERGG
jgi:ribokinase